MWLMLVGSSNSGCVLRVQHFEMSSSHTDEGEVRHSETSEENVY
jgi:hypothetical protein